MKNIYWMSLVSRISTIWKADTYKTHLSLSTREVVPKNLNFEVILLHRLGSIGIPIMELKYTKSSLYRGHWTFISPIQINIAPANRPSQKEISSSNHQFSGRFVPSSATAHFTTLPARHPNSSPWLHPSCPARCFHRSQPCENTTRWLGNTRWFMEVFYAKIRHFRGKKLHHNFHSPVPVPFSIHQFYHSLT